MRHCLIRQKTADSPDLRLLGGPGAEPATPSSGAPDKTEATPYSSPSRDESGARVGTGEPDGPSHPSPMSASHSPGEPKVARKARIGRTRREQRTQAGNLTHSVSSEGARRFTTEVNPPDHPLPNFNSNFNSNPNSGAHLIANTDLGFSEPLLEEPTLTEARVRPRQGSLFPFVNPLISRLGAEFFQNLPRQPGVYLMRGEQDSLLYVGKAKDLKARLYSYRTARPDQVSRKVIRLVHLIRRIEWRLCASEEDALLTENQLLRLHRPPFNVMNVHPESYYLIGFRRDGHRLHFRLTTSEESAEQGPETELAGRETVFGAYKGRGSVRGGYQALLRLLWACHNTLENQMSFPPRLTHYRAPERFELLLPKAIAPAELENWELRIRRFLNGTSRGLLSRLTQVLLSNEALPRFIYRTIQEDLESIESFYHIGPSRNRLLKRFHHLPGRQLIPQTQLDDLLVKYKSRERRAREKREA